MGAKRRRRKAMLKPVLKKGLPPQEVYWGAAPIGWRWGGATLRHLLEADKTCGLATHCGSPL